RVEIKQGRLIAGRFKGHGNGSFTDVQRFLIIDFIGGPVDMYQSCSPDVDDTELAAVQEMIRFQRRNGFQRYLSACRQYTTGYEPVVMGVNEVYCIGYKKVFD